MQRRPAVKRSTRGQPDPHEAGTDGERSAGDAVVAAPRRRRVQNHIGTVHAIALCNLAELCAGLVTDVSIPADMRWIPQDMTVRYLRKAKGRMAASAVPATELRSSAEPYPATIAVTITDDEGQTVASADIHMWLSPRPARR